MFAGNPRSGSVLYGKSVVSKRFNLRWKISGRDVLILSGKLLVWKRSGKETAGEDALTRKIIDNEAF